jgi:hypothetical protein
MEKQLSDLSCFAEYHHRQVVLNYYRDEDFLWKRDGFHFEYVKFAEGKLVLLVKGGYLTSVDLGDFESVVLNTDFPNYYICRKGSDRLEIYFP